MSKCLFVYNPNSGKSGLIKRINYIINELNTIYDEVEYKPTEYRGHATEIAKNACGKYTHLIVSGGDGTFNEIVNGVAEQEDAPIIGYLPSGTVNDISKSLKISKNLKKALQSIRDNNVFNHDIFKANEKYGIYICGAGAFTSASWDTKQKSKKFWGKVAYFFHGIHEIFNLPDFDISITDSNNTELANGKYIMLLIINSRSTAGFLLNSKANLSDGNVDVVLVKRENNKLWTYISSVVHIAKIFLFDYSLLKNNKYITKFSASEFKIKNNKRAIINVDGEKGPFGNIDFKVINQGLKIIVPSKTIKHQFKIQNKQKKKAN